MTPVKRRGVYRWTQEQHEAAVKKWEAGLPIKQIADELGLTPRLVGHHISIYRDVFPRRRAVRGANADQQRQFTVGLCADEHDLLSAAAKRAGVSIAVMVRNAILLSKEKGYPVIDPDALRGVIVASPGSKAKHPFKDRTAAQKSKKPLIPYAGGTSRRERKQFDAT